MITCQKKEFVEITSDCSSGWNEIDTDNILPKAFSYYGVVDDKIYALFGENAQSDHTRTNTSTYFDPTTNQFTQIVTLDGVGAERCAGVLNDTLYFFETDTDYYRYESNNTFTFFNDGTNAGRQGCCTATFNNKIYICGGFTQNCTTFDGTTFQELPGNFAGGIRPFQCRMVVFNNTLFSIGGDAFSGPPISNISYYDTVNEIWTSIGNMPYTVAGGAVVVFDNFVYYIGGYTGLPGSVVTYSNVTIIDLYDITNVTTSAGPEFPVPIAGHGAATIGGRIYVIYGHNHATNNVEPATSSAYTKTYQYCQIGSTTGTTGFPDITDNTAVGTSISISFVVGSMMIVVAIVCLSTGVPKTTMKKIRQRRKKIEKGV